MSQPTISENQCHEKLLRERERAKPAMVRVEHQYSQHLNGTALATNVEVAALDDWLIIQTIFIPVLHCRTDKKAKAPRWH